MSFLNQLKMQASALQNEQVAQLQNLEENADKTERACKIVWQYLQELARQLSVIAPEAPRFSLDGKTYWPPMKLVNFRADARKKKLRDKDVYDYIAVGWEIASALLGGTRRFAASPVIPLKYDLFTALTPSLPRRKSATIGAPCSRKSQDTVLIFSEQ